MTGEFAQQLISLGVVALAISYLLFSRKLMRGEGSCGACEGCEKLHGDETKCYQD